MYRKDADQGLLIQLQIFGRIETAEGSNKYIENTIFTCATYAESEIREKLSISPLLMYV